MKTSLLVGLALLLASPAFSADAPPDAAPPQHREITIWVSSKTGTHLGSGYASTYLTNIRARTIAQDEPALRNAVISLDGLGMLAVRGYGLVPAAVAWQGKVPLRKLIAQQAKTGLSYGELLVAHSFAAESRLQLDQIIALRARSHSWGEVARQIQVDPHLVVTRLQIASRQIVAADLKTRRNPGRTRDPALTDNAPHWRAQHQ